MARKKRPDGFPKVTLKNISRPEPEFFGWRVNVKRHGKDNWKSFPDGPDGPFESLRAAIHWRDREWARLGPPSHVWSKSPKSDSGVIGVWRATVRTASGRIYETWTTRWVDADNKHPGRSFSVDKYGDAEAKRLATAARKAGLAETRKERARRLADKLFVHRRMIGSGPKDEKEK